MTDAERKALARTYAEDRSLAMERATGVVDELSSAMSDALIDWVTQDVGKTDRVRKVITNALFRLYRMRRTRDASAALAPALVGYTTAPEGYDHDYVKTVETFTIVGGRKDLNWRKIEVYDLDRFQNYQLPRYSSGLYGFQENDPREEQRARQAESSEWYYSAQGFVAEEIGKLYAAKRKKGYKPSYSDNERLSALEVMRDILNEGPSRDTEERFKSMKLAFLGMGSSARGRR